MNIVADSNGHPILEQFCEEGFVDCVFKIATIKETSNSYQFHIIASHESSVVGMDVEIIKDIQGGFDEDMQLVKEHVYRKGVIFRRSGEESDRLISTLAKLYGFKGKDFVMIDEEKHTGIALHQGALDMSKELTKIKIFGRDSEMNMEEDRYYESFFNLDIKNGFVYWNEKDPDYREPLIQALSNKKPPKWRLL